MSDSTTPEGGYAHARDLPAFRDAERQLAAARALLFLRPDLRPKLDEVEQLKLEIVQAVEGFYRLLSDRGWIFIGRFSVERFNALAQAGDASSMEGELLSWFKNPKNLQWLVANARVIPELRERAHLLDLAVMDMAEGRHYAVVQNLLSVMDGYVSDLEPGRRQGLHAKAPETMVAWNSVVGHHAGLVAALRIYGTHFGSIVTDEVFNLYRHGIVHGMVVHFNNARVSSKAWNMLAALVELQQANEQARRPAKPTKNLRQTLIGVAEANRRNASLKNWEPRTWSAADGQALDPSADPLIAGIFELYDGWRDKKWGLLASRLVEHPRPKSPGAFAGDLRTRFATPEIDAWGLASVDVPSSMSADVECFVEIAGSRYVSLSKWFLEDPAGNFVNEFDPNGVWKSVQNYPDELVRGYPFEPPPVTETPS